jgi:hypothetical protein
VHERIPNQRFLPSLSIKLSVDASRALYMRTKKKKVTSRVWPHPKSYMCPLAESQASKVFAQSYRPLSSLLCTCVEIIMSFSLLAWYGHRGLGVNHEIARDPLIETTYTSVRGASRCRRRTCRKFCTTNVVLCRAQLEDRQF